MLNRIFQSLPEAQRAFEPATAAQEIVQAWEALLPRLLAYTDASSSEKDRAQPALIDKMGALSDLEIPGRAFLKNDPEVLSRTVGTYLEQLKGRDLTPIQRRALERLDCARLATAAEETGIETIQDLIATPQEEVIRIFELKKSEFQLLRFALALEGVLFKAPYITKDEISKLKVPSSQGITPQLLGCNIPTTRIPTTTDLKKYLKQSPTCELLALAQLSPPESSFKLLGHPKLAKILLEKGMYRLSDLVCSHPDTVKSIAAEFSSQRSYQVLMTGTLLAYTRCVAEAFGTTTLNLLHSKEQLQG